jgi:hypothetical protein
MKWARALKKALLSNGTIIEFIDSRGVAADRNKRTSVCGTKEPNAKKKKRKTGLLPKRYLG